MLSVREHSSMEEASRSLLAFVLEPRNWVQLEGLSENPSGRPGSNPSYQRRVGSLRICVSVDVGPKLETFLRIGFRGPGLTPSKAADHLESFLKERIPLMPNSEWQVEVDPKSWIHSMRPYLSARLEA